MNSYPPPDFDGDLSTLVVWGAGAVLALIWAGVVIFGLVHG
jgi:hypothetical protein